MYVASDMDQHLRELGKLHVCSIHVEKKDVNHKVDVEELEKYIFIDKDPMKRACTSLLFRNAMLIAVTEFYDPTASHVRLADAATYVIEWKTVGV